jgi:diaminopimelate decarboxylase
MTKNRETPFFILRESLLRQNVEAFFTALAAEWPHADVAYSVKTNALPWILQWMDRHGVLAEAVSDDEYELAELCGFEDRNIVFNGPVKGAETFARAARQGAYINIDSQNDLALLKQEPPRSPERIGVRINIPTDLFDERDIGYEADGFRFGFSRENGALGRVIGEVQTLLGSSRFGLHTHVNSVTRSPEVYRRTARYVAGIVREYGLDPAFIDVGGGFFGGVPGKPGPLDYIRTIREELLSAVDPERTRLIVEPGSAVVGSAIELHTTVVDVKDTARARIVTTDGSRVHIDPLWRKTGYLFTTDAQRPPFPRQIVCGYTCMDHDRIMTLADQPELREGDRIVYHRVGNYTVTFGGPFIQGLPPVYAEREDGAVVMIRKPMDMKDYYRMETC